MCQWLYSEYWHKHVIKERGKKEILPVVPVAQYPSVVSCSIITLYAAASHHTFLGGGGDMKVKTVKHPCFISGQKKCLLIT